MRFGLILIPKKTTVPHHREIKEGTLGNILKQGQVDVEDFLEI